MLKNVITRNGKQGRHMPEWVKHACFYEIYPQSFMDFNGDGIGDLKGIISKLDYLKETGFNALWINPIFDSPFKDAGYDVRDYRLVAERYGTNEDSILLFKEAHKRDIRVLLDLVPGHTSEEHEWFKRSSQAELNEYSSRYIWTDSWFKGCSGYPYIGGETPRNGTYILNFFKCQPALNYGFLIRTDPWQSAVDSDEAIATKEAMMDVMRFWLSQGCDGFRVDMADSLVKNDDENKQATAAIWSDVREMLEREFPDAALVSEWSNPLLSIKAGFHMDFCLDHIGNAYNTLVRDYENPSSISDHSFFKTDSNGSARVLSQFLSNTLPQIQDEGYVAWISGNHDTPRISRTLSIQERKLFFLFLYTIPGVPFMYYGDEIGLSYRELPSKEGGYTRTGSRTPMQWDINLKNYGFSECETDQLYLPVEELPSENDISQGAKLLSADVASQKNDPDSLYMAVKTLLHIRQTRKELQADGAFAIEMQEGQVLCYKRGDLKVCLDLKYGHGVLLDTKTNTSLFEV